MSIYFNPTGCKELLKVTLPEPRNGDPQTYFYDEDNICLYEITRYSDKFRSWFVDDRLIQEGQIDMLTKVDPLYILLRPIMAIADKQFRTVQDICSTYESTLSKNSSKLSYALSPDIRWDSICETKELDDELFVRYNETKTRDWLKRKMDSVMKALELQYQTNSKPSKATIKSYAMDLIAAYIPNQLSHLLR